MNYRILTLCIVLMKTGCFSMTHTVGDGRGFNDSLPIQLQHMLHHQELAYCTQAADQWIPLPEVTFNFGGVRHINGAPNVSVEGNQTAVTTSPVDHRVVTGSFGSEVGFWKTDAASSINGYRESQQKQQCITSLGWLSTDDIWDGTLSQLNETVAVNKAGMAAVKEGFSHPLLGDRVIALLDLSESTQSDTGAVVTATVIPLFDPVNPSFCVYEIGQSWLSDQATVKCNEGSAQSIGIASKSPIDMWLGGYF